MVGWGKAALETVAAANRITLAEADRTTILATMRNLPPHPDIIPGLKRLQAAGFRLATLTNSC
ncbi:MAG: hypothetical protein H6636_09155 [Anaerolineales bacterium]|nr:hypothetical protein [Anaerolineales bacterium]